MIKSRSDLSSFEAYIEDLARDNNHYVVQPEDLNEFLTLAQSLVIFARSRSEFLSAAVQTLVRERRERAHDKEMKEFAELWADYVEAKGMDARDELIYLHTENAEIKRFMQMYAVEIDYDREPVTMWDKYEHYRALGGHQFPEDQGGF